MRTQLQHLREHGQSPWIDFITRRFLQEGEFAELIEQGVVGITSNPTIFQKAIADDDLYDEQLQRLADEGREPYDAFIEMAAQDIRTACDQLAGTFATGGSNGIRDGWVSLEVDPRLAHDAERTLAEARRLHELVDRPNLMVKIPGTEEGLQAIESAIAIGIPINVTLLFSREQYLAAADAFMRGVERRIDDGLDPAVPSVASLFISRWDVAVADEAPDELRNRLGIAISKRTYVAYRELLDSERWQHLANEGARPQRLLWASTGTKDPDAPDALYVEALAAPFTINTMPDKTLLAFAERGQVGEPLSADGGDADQVLADFEASGIEVAELPARLQREGAEAFDSSWRELMESIESKSRKLAATK